MAEKRTEAAKQMAKEVAALSGASHEERAAQVAWAMLQKCTASALQYDYTLCPSEALREAQSTLRQALREAAETIVKGK